MRSWEVPVFFGIALAMHVAAFALIVEGGQDAAPGGAGGEAAVTVAAASPEVAALVEEWEAPPEAVEMAEPPSPTSARQDVPAPPRLAPAPAPEAPRASAPLAVLPEAPLPDTPLPAPAEPPPVEPEEPVVPPEPEPEEVVEPAVPEAEPAVEPEEVEPEPTTALARSMRPAPRPESVVRAPTPPQSVEPDPAPQAAEVRAEQRAAGPRRPAHQGGTGQAAVATASPGQQANLVRVWGAQIQGRLQRALVYPRQAQMRGIAGQTVVELTVRADGRILGRRVVGSSESEMLDQAALSTVDRASGIPPAPSGLPGSSFTFQLPVVFQGR